jgi:peptide/nickel transport system permease protein
MKRRSSWKQFYTHKIGMLALIVLIFFAIVGLYAPFLVSSKAFAVHYNEQWYFPLFRYLFYHGFYTKALDIFYNLLMFTLPLALISLFIFKRKRKTRFTVLSFILLLQVGLFLYFTLISQKDPASSAQLNLERQTYVKENLAKGKRHLPSWQFTLDHMTDYAKLDLVLSYIQSKKQHQLWLQYAYEYTEKRKEIWLKKEHIRTSKTRENILAETSPDELDLHTGIPSLYQVEKNNTYSRKKNLSKRLESSQSNEDILYLKAKINYIQDKEQWLEIESKKINHLYMPPLRPFHWEEDVGGNQSFNQYLPWWEVTRINRKDMVSALIFGIRISLMVGVTALLIQLLIGIPIGSAAGYFGGKCDILSQRLVEVWEGMPTFFMLLLVVAITQSKSVFLVIIVLGLFGWTGFCRFIRGEVLKQRHLPYVEACRSIGFPNKRIIFRHILPNAIPPILTLIPFAMLAAITSEAGLSFLGLGEEGSCSWGVLMDEGRQAFPGESYLLWPPAFILTLMLIAIALVQDAIRDCFDPKMKS